MRLLSIAALFALLQDKPVYDKSWQEESIVVKRKDEKSGKEAAIIKVNFVKPHKLSDCLGKEFSDVLRDYPSARLYKGGSIRASFKTGDPYHVHLLREDGSDLAISVDGDVLTLSAEDLKPARRLIAVSSRFDVSVTRPNEKESRLHLPPYVVSMELVDAKDPLSEGTAQSTAQVGGSVLADVRPYSDYEFALGVIHEGEAQPIEIGFGDHLLRPRMAFEGAIGKQHQHVGIYPIPMVARKSKGELNVGVGGSTFKYKGFPHTLLDLEFPQDVDALEATVKGKLQSNLPLTALVFSGAMVKEPAAFRAAAIELGDKRELEAKIVGEAETFFFVRLWTAYKKRGGMLGCGMMEEGVRGPYKYLVEPPPRPFYTIRMRGSRTASEAGQILGQSPAALLPLLGSGLMGVGLASALGSAGDGLFGTGGGAGGGNNIAVPNFPSATELPTSFDPNSLTIMPAQRMPNGGGGPSWPTNDPKKPTNETFAIKFEGDSVVDFGQVVVNTEARPKKLKCKYTYDDGNPDTQSLKKVIPPMQLGGVFSVSPQFQFLPEGKDLMFDVDVKFKPIHEKHYVENLAISHDVKGIPMRDAQATLKGEGVKDKPKPRFHLHERKDIDFGEVIVGTKEMKTNEFIEFDWDDADPKNEIRVELLFEVVEDTSGGDLKIISPTGKRFYSKGEKLPFLISFAPKKTGKVHCKFRITARIEGSKEVLGEKDVYVRGEGVETRILPPPTGDIQVKVPPGSSFKASAKYKVIIKDSQGYRIETGDEKKKGCAPGTTVILTPASGNGGRIFVTPPEDENLEFENATPAKAIPQCPENPESASRTLPPTQINPEDPYVITIPVQPGQSPIDIYVHTENGVQQPESIGTLTTPDGKTVAVYTARCAPEMAGSNWTIKDKDGRTIAEVNTYFWAPAGPPEIDRLQVGVMSFQRFGKGPAAPVVIQAKNLTLDKVDGDIKEVKIEKSRATGNVPEGSPKVNVTFRSGNAEKEGEIDLIEPKK